MNDKIDLRMLARDGNAPSEALARGELLVAQANENFLYILESDGCFKLFSHMAGAGSGGKKSFPIDEKHRAIVKNLANIADALYAVGFDADMDVFGVMASAEEAICELSMEFGAGGAGDIVFAIPGETP
ncbi:MAG: hypothetical protein LBP30_05115 [Clostridiales Family XIII bacterium]|jgi:hypothetical protein|nr:hypothetical protein [Clostridiales Family XIII bacterium]